MTSPGSDNDLQRKGQGDENDLQRQRREEEKQEEIETGIDHHEIAIAEGDKELHVVNPYIVSDTVDPEDPHSNHDRTGDPGNKNEGSEKGDGENHEEITEQGKGDPVYVSADAPFRERLWEVFVTFWPLGLVAFGGPTATVALLRAHLVERRKWIDEETFLELFAIGQGLPGPTSTQLVISTALTRAGPVGALLAFFLWNLPGLIVLTLCGILIKEFINPRDPPFWLVGLPPAAISLVFRAFYSFAAPLDKFGVVLGLLTCMTAVLISNDSRIPPTSSQFVFPSIMALSGLATLLDSHRSKPFSKYKSPSRGWDAKNDETVKRIGIPLYAGAFIFFLWLGMLVTVILLNNLTHIENKNLDIFETMYRVGSVLFGGGQVVVPLIQNEVVPGWMTKDQFLQGLALTQSMPGPLFNFAAYLGAVYNGAGGAFVGFMGLFGPGVGLIFAIVPFWAHLRHNRTFRCILPGLNAGAIGLVGAACIVLWETAIGNASDAMVFSFSLTLDAVFRVPAPLVVLAGGVFGAILHRDALDLGQRPYCIQEGFLEP